MKKIELPGSKSISNRVLILAALSPEPVELYGLLESDDTRYMQAALEQFGVEFKSLKKGGTVVIPPEKLAIKNDTEIFIGNAGTAARFLSAVSLVIEGSFCLSGVKRMHQRPQKDLQKALQDLGVELGSLEREGSLPTRFTTNKATKTSTVELSGQVSSQFLTALMLVAPRLENGLTIKINGHVPSWPYIEMTLELLRTWGVSFSLIDQERIQIGAGIHPPKSYHVPADMSAASYPVAWSLLSGTSIEIMNFGEQTLQGDEAFLDIATKMGADVEQSDGRCLVIPPKELKPMGDTNWSAIPDVAMTGMVLASVTPGTTQFTGLESLRVKECDRIVAMEQLVHLGVDIEVQGDDMFITGNPDLKVTDTKLTIKSYDDHRIAMSFGVLRATQNLDFEISELECVAKTWPEFWVELADWQDQLRLVSGIILHRVGTNCGKDKYLIVKKPRKDHAWQFPQGGVDTSETGLQAAKRELAEECGTELSVKFKGEKPVGTYKYLFPKNFKRHDKSILGADVQFFRADHISGQVKVDDEEITDHAWVEVSQLEDYFESPYLEVMKDMMS